METETFLEYLAKQTDLLQRKAVELEEQHDEIEKQIKSYKQLVRMYRGVYESEAGVGLRNRVPSEIVEALERMLSEEEKPKKRTAKTKRRRKAK